MLLCQGEILRRMFRPPVCSQALCRPCRLDDGRGNQERQKIHQQNLQTDRFRAEGLKRGR